MSKHIIFFVHGIGDDAKGWSKDLRAQFKALFDSYPLPPGGQPFSVQFQTEEIFYNDFFDDWRKRVAQEAGKNLKMLGDGGMSQASVTRLLEAGVKSGGGGFARTHALDVLQYRFLRLIADAVRDSVEKQIMTKLEESEFGTMSSWTVIAHSLGTAVVHDTLYEMFRPGPGAQGSAQFQPHAVVMLANVSQLLHDEGLLEGADAYGTIVRPNREPGLGACRYYLTARNGLDPVAIAGNFDPPANWLTEPSKVQRRFRRLEFNAIPKSRNVHGFGEYLAHPAVHVPLFRNLTGDQDWIGEEAEKAAHAKYEAENPQPSAEDLKRRAIEELIQRAKQNEWFERISMWKEVLEKFTRN